MRSDSVVTLPQPADQPVNPYFLNAMTNISTEASTAPGNLERPKRFSLDIASGMLESLGLNMYTSIGKSLSEFVANAFDADATKVEIVAPFELISQAREELREKAKAEVKAGAREKFTVLVDPLPDNIQISISDDGHGMTPEEIKNKLLVVSRNRRRSSVKSESGNRYVMGRKGLGKLAGFGTAERVTIWSKRKGSTFATEFTMDYRQIEGQQQLSKNTFEARYTDDLPIEMQGTKVTLSALRCDSLKSTEDTVRNVLAQNFSIQGEDFRLYLNEAEVTEPAADFEFIYPEESSRDSDGFGKFNVVVNEMFSFDIRYQVRFRAREADQQSSSNKIETTESKDKELLRGSLPTALRGARIYCNNRLAAGPSLLKLHTGMHNFHSQAYMECIVHADDVDRQEVDHIGTNRADLKGDSEIVESLRDAVTELMRLALYEHSKFRDKVAEKLVEQDAGSKIMLSMVADLSPSVRRSSLKILRTLASSQGVNSDLYKEVAPLLLQSMNTGEVLSQLIRIEQDPKSIQVLAHNLLELARIENHDVLKLYRGRKRGIEGLRKLLEQSQGTWKKGRRFENQLHGLLKDNPWLIGPEFSRYLTSDNPLGDVAKELTRELKIDGEAPHPNVDENGEIFDKDTRPDLVFVMGDASSPSKIVVVELKTPNYPLQYKHLTQLQQYMMHVDEWLSSKGQSVQVRGYLIGDMDPKPHTTETKMLAKSVAEAGPLTLWEVLPLSKLLDRAKLVHLDAIEVAEKTDEFFARELSTEPEKKSPAPLLI